ncbi:MAG TPA: hypothetical protein VJ750_02755 [Rhizomicrobium sp.]|nr:hypothetical protein [Rhizomicrobium sp.]
MAVAFRDVADARTREVSDDDPENPNARDGPDAGDAYLLIFSAAIRSGAPKKGGQELPVRQSLPVAHHRMNRVKTQRNRAKIAHLRWHGACDSLCGTMYSDDSP